MKFSCPACGQLAEASSFRVDGGALLLTCGRCGVENRTEPAAQPSAAAPAISPGRELPAPRPAVPAPNIAPNIAPSIAPVRSEVRPNLQLIAGASAARLTEEELFFAPAGFCAKCVAARPEAALACPQCGLVYDNFVAADHLVSSALRQALLELNQAWQDPAAHQRFLRLAEVGGELAPAGRLYRIRLARTPSDPLALQGRDEVLRRVAGRSLELARTADPERARKARRFLLTTVFFTTVVAVVLILRVLARLRS